MRNHEGIFKQNTKQKTQDSSSNSISRKNTNMTGAQDQPATHQSKAVASRLA